jgi:hypothetical protein
LGLYNHHHFNLYFSNHQDHLFKSKSFYCENPPAKHFNCLDEKTIHDNDND